MDPLLEDRYSRQILFGPIGADGQRRFGAATAAIVGCGALGAFQAGALARAGIGRLIVIDRDFVEASNLQRQWLFDESDALQALPKAEAARRHLAGINRDVEVEAHVADLTPSNVEELLENASVVLDATDNFETRYLINDYCVTRSLPWVYGGAVGSYGICFPVLPGAGPCFECVYPEPPQGPQPTCETAGVLNTITSAVASFQVSHVYRILLSEPGDVPLLITTIDAWSMQVRQIRLPAADTACPACAARSCRHLRGEGRAPISLCGRNAVQIHERRRPVDLPALAGRLSPLGEVRQNGFALRFLAPPYDITVFPDGRAIIKGTTDPGLARSLYSRYIGN